MLLTTRSSAISCVFDQRPPLPQSAAPNGIQVSRRPSYPSKLNLNHPTAAVSDPDGVSNPGPTQATQLIPLVFTLNIPTTPISPLPPHHHLMLKPYHMMNLLISKTGDYVTRRLHVRNEVWSQGDAKLNNMLEEVHVVEVLCSA